MANQDAAFGFRPTRHLSGGLIRAEEMNIAANYNTAIYNGQVVEAVAAGGIEAAAAGDTQMAGVSVVFLILIPLLQNQPGQIIILQAPMLQILKRPCIQTLTSYSKRNMMKLEQRQ